MKAMDKLIAKIDKKLERFDPIWQAEHGTGGQIRPALRSGANGAA